MSTVGGEEGAPLSWLLLAGAAGRRGCDTQLTDVGARPEAWQAGVKGKALTSQGSQVVKAAVCKTVYRWFDSIPWDHRRRSDKPSRAVMVTSGRGGFSAAQASVSPCMRGRSTGRGR